MAGSWSPVHSFAVQDALHPALEEDIMGLPNKRKRGTSNTLFT